ncbi:MAG: TonB-dependent receptor [Gammaproteobacteria bacterium]|nr:TonB-dependent receptor [Gammaproteobacteria bacterium]
MKNTNTMKRAIQGSTGLMTILFALGASGMPVIAQEEEGRLDTSTLFIEEVVITAQRRDQSLSKVGISVTALGTDSIRRQSIDDLGKVAALVPGLDIFRGNGSNNPTITLRGIGTTNPWANNNQSVASYVDGAYLPFSSYLTFPLFDLERIEVLKGPQIALYGRNATAGAVNFISARPSDEMEGYADVSYGEYNALNVKAAVSGPVTDNLQLRVAAIITQGGGYVDRPGTGVLTGFTRRPGVIPGIPAADPEDNYGDKDVFALRASATLQLTPEVEAFLTFHYGQDKSELIGSTNINGDRLGIFTPLNEAAFVDYDNISPKTDTEQYGGVLRIDWSSGDYTFSSITGFENLDRKYAIGDFVPTRIAEASFVEYIKSISQEFTVAFDGGEQLQWLAGASYTRDDIDYSRDLVSYDLLLGGLGTSFVEIDKSFAVFGQGELALSDQWLLTLGLRYTNEDKSYDGGSVELDPFGTSVVRFVFPNTAGAGLLGTPTYDETDLSGKAALNWQPTDDVLVYASLSKGFKSGGFDGSGVTEPAAFTPFQSESVWTYELGTKATLFSGHVFVTASAFYNDYTDKQVIALVDLGGGLTEAIIQNAASSKVYGLDFEAKWNPVQSLSFSLSGTLLESEVTNWNSPDLIRLRLLSILVMSFLARRGFL